MRAGEEKSALARSQGQEWVLLTEVEKVGEEKRNLRQLVSLSGLEWAPSCPDELFPDLVHGWHLSIIPTAPSAGPTAATACSAAASSPSAASRHRAVHLT